MSAHDHAITRHHLLTFAASRAIGGEPPLMIWRAVAAGRFRTAMMQSAAPVPSQRRIHSTSADLNAEL
jgi:hypothetical protein